MGRPGSRQGFRGQPFDWARRSCRDGHVQPDRPVSTLTGVLLIVCGLVVLVIVAVPALIGVAFSAQAEPSSTLKTAVGDEARTIAYSLRNDGVRSALDGGATLSEIAAGTATMPQTTARIAAVGTDAVGAGSPVLLRARPVGASGAAVDVAWGGVIGGEAEFGPPERPWVTCLRIGLPATAIDATAWTVEDVDCPTFIATVRKDAARIHANDFDTTPLLRPPCFGTTGYCPGG